MRDTLVKSILGLVFLFLAVQFVIFLAYAIPFGFANRYLVLFSLSTVTFHGLLLFVLFLFRHDFIKEPSGEKLVRVNLANKITLFRVSTLPTILFVIIASKDYPMRYPLIALVAVVFFTDFLDGYVSRKGKEVTRVGKMMDSASDYTVLFVISIVYYYFHLIPVWFLVLLVARLAGQTIMVLIVLAIKKRITPKTTILGKITVAATMILYACELLRFAANLPASIYMYMEAVVGIIVVSSIVDKVILMIKDLREPAPTATEPGRINSVTTGE